MNADADLEGWEADARKEQAEQPSVLSGGWSSCATCGAPLDYDRGARVLALIAEVRRLRAALMAI